MEEMTEVSIFKQEVREVLEDNILRFWIERMQDEEHGGFYGRIDNQNILHADADKGAILNARILWTYGGVYWSLDYKGQPKDTKKQFYAIGFAIYGLSEYARATNDQEALEQAINLYRCVEEHALDKEYNGYIEAMTRNWQPIDDMRLSEYDANYPKSQNTHLHIIEPYANLYRVWPSAGLGQSLRNIISIFTDRILNPETHHLDLFFEMDWTRGAGQLESYGHDIECSWLMHEAALVWWVQAEAVVGFFNIYQHFHDEAALEKALRCWQYTKDNLIDYQNGEWYWSRHRDGSLNTVDDKAGFWKCPYHNGRMCLEIIER